MRTLSGFAAVLCLAAGSAFAEDSRFGVHPDPSVIVDTRPLWPEGRIPGFKEGQTPCPQIEWYAPPAKPNGACMMLVSGGSYDCLSDIWILDGIAKRFTELGIQCVNLKYRVPRSTPKYLIGWQDGQRAVRLVRSEAARRGFRADRIGALGTSAGGHLVLMLATSSKTAAYEPVDELDSRPCGIDLAVPVFPGYGLSIDGDDAWSLEEGRSELHPSSVPKYDDAIPPTCFLHGGADWVTPYGSIFPYLELHRRKVPCELHLFADRGHGFMMGAKEGSASDHWLGRVEEFMTQMEFTGRLPEARPYSERRTSSFTAKTFTEPIWPEGKMPSVSTNQTYAPEITWYYPKTLKTTSIQVVFPGGAYVHVSLEKEGQFIAEKFNELGMMTVVLKYRTPRPLGQMKHLTAWQDAQRALRLVRYRAKNTVYNGRRLGLETDSVGVIGFSAGGHLTLMAATSSMTESYKPIDDIDLMPCRVDWALPIYPAYIFGEGAKEGTICADFRFDLATPPMCFIHGDADGAAPVTGSVAMWERLRRMGIQCDLHTLATRSHCFYFKSSDGTGSASWFDPRARFSSATAGGFAIAREGCMDGLQRRS